MNDLIDNENKKKTTKDFEYQDFAIDFKDYDTCRNWLILRDEFILDTVSDETIKNGLFTNQQQEEKHPRFHCEGRKRH